MLRSDGIGPQDGGLHGGGEPPEPTAPDAPAAPTLVSRTTSAITITLPAMPAGGDTLYLLVEAYDGMTWNEVSDEAVTPEAELELDGLDSASRFRFSCHAENEIGDSGPGEDLEAWTYPLAPFNCVADQPELGDPTFAITFDADEGTTRLEVENGGGGWNTLVADYESGQTFWDQPFYQPRLITTSAGGDDSEPTEVLLVFNGIDAASGVSFTGFPSLDVSWDAHPEGDDIDGFELYYSLNGSEFGQELPGSPATPGTAALLGSQDLSGVLLIGDSVRVEVIPYNTTGSGTYYGAADDYTDTWDWDASDLAVTATQNSGDIDLSWSPHAQASYVSGFQLYHQLDGGGWSLLDTVMSGAATSYTHTGGGATTGTHQYKLVPYSGANDSPTESVSNEVVVS